MADQPQAAHHHVGQPLPLQHQGDLIQDVRRQVGDGVLHGDVAEEGDLLQDLLRDGGVAAADDDVGLDAQGQQLLGRVLGGLALQLAGAGDGDDEGDVDEHHVLPPPLGGHLADGLQEGLGLDVAHGAADLHDGHVGVRGVQGVDVPLDLVGDVGDDLHGAAQIVPRPLPVEHVPVDLAGGDGGVEGQVLVDEPLVVAQVQVGLRPVVGDEHLAVLIGAHGAGVHVEIGIQLLDLDPQAPLLQQTAQAAAVIPLPRPDTTPPVTKIYLTAMLDSSVFMDTLGLAGTSLPLPCFSKKLIHFTPSARFRQGNLQFCSIPPQKRRRAPIGAPALIGDRACWSDTGARRSGCRPSLLIGDLVRRGQDDGGVGLAAPQIGQLRAGPRRPGGRWWRRWPGR